MCYLKDGLCSKLRGKRTQCDISSSSKLRMKIDVKALASARLAGRQEKGACKRGAQSAVDKSISNPVLLACQAVEALESCRHLFGQTT